VKTILSICRMLVRNEPVHVSPVAMPGSGVRGKRCVLDLRKRLRAHVYRGVRFVYGREEGLVVSVDLNSGAGYIGGATAFLALFCKGKGSRSMYTRVPVQAGITRNANLVPYEF
jgi:hypothetical protein